MKSLYSTCGFKLWSPYGNNVFYKMEDILFIDLFIFIYVFYVSFINWTTLLLKVLYLCHNIITLAKRSQ